MASTLSSQSLASQSVTGTKEMRPVRIRTITAGVPLRTPEDRAPFERAIALLARARTRVEAAGYELQTVRIATQPMLAGADPDSRKQALPALEALDRLAAQYGVITNIGPLLTNDVVDPELGAWCAELVRRTRTISFSVRIASAAGGVHRKACLTAADITRALETALPGGVANFRFAAAANVPPGTPFFPVGYHEGDPAIAIGLESASLVQSAMAGATDAADAEQRLRHRMNEVLREVEAIGVELAASERVRYLGIDASPAPGLDRSIGAAIEAFTHVPFGSASTLTACATITAVLKSLSVKTCGYSGLMLPVLEDPVLAARAREGRYGIEELLLYSTVCGTGLDVVPIPGDTPVESIARVIDDLATLSAKLSKPLSTRLFPAPGAKAGDAVRFDDPHLTETSVFAVD